MPSFVLACELLSAEYRAFAMVLVSAYWSIATCFYGLLAYLVQNWVHLQLIISLLGLLTIPLYWSVVHTIFCTEYTWTWNVYTEWDKKLHILTDHTS